MNGYDVGGRTLRVGWADQESTTVPSIQHGHQPANQQISSNPILAPTGVPSVDAVNSTLASLSNSQIHEVITQLKASSRAHSFQDLSTLTIVIIIVFNHQRPDGKRVPRVETLTIRFFNFVLNTQQKEDLLDQT